MEVLYGKNPIDKFEMDAVDAFVDFQNRVELDIIAEFENLKLDSDCINTLNEKFVLPTSTWTYLLKDNSFEESLGLKLFSKSNMGISAFAMIFNWPIIMATFMFERLKGKNILKNNL